LDKEKYANLKAAIERIEPVAEKATKDCQTLAEKGMNSYQFKHMADQLRDKANVGNDIADVHLNHAVTTASLMFFIESLGMGLTLHNYRLMKEVDDRETQIADLNATISDLSNRLAKLETPFIGEFEDVE
jgi:hypothetical protein